MIAKPPKPPPPYPHSTQLHAAMSREGGRDVLECAVCRMRPALWHCAIGRYSGYYLRCGECGCVGLSATGMDQARDQAAKAWNAVQTAKAKPKRLVCHQPYRRDNPWCATMRNGKDAYAELQNGCLYVQVGDESLSVPDVHDGEEYVFGLNPDGSAILVFIDGAKVYYDGELLADLWERSNWGPGLPAKDDTVSFEAGSMSINEVRQAEGLPAVRAEQTITNAIIAGGTVTYLAYPELTWAPKACGCIPLSRREKRMRCNRLHLWRRFNEWRNRPSRKPKPFLKPLRKHWWQVRRETMASFEKRMFNAA